jgi:WD40 repeat protein
VPWLIGSIAVLLVLGGTVALAFEGVNRTGERLAGAPGAPKSDENPAPSARTDDVFTRAATFKPDGPLPELPPLPPVDQRPVLTLDPGGHTAFVRDVFFTPDAKRVISMSEDKSVRIWDVASGELLSTIRVPAGPDAEGILFGAALAPDGKQLAVGGFPLGRGKSGFLVYLFSVETGQLLSTVGGAPDVIRVLDFSPDGKQLAVGCGNGALQVYEFASKKWVYKVAAHTRLVTQVRFNPKRGTLATLGAEKEVKTWDLGENTDPVTHVKLSAEGANTIDWTSDGETLAVGNTDGTVRTYDRAGKLLKKAEPALEGKNPIQVVRLRVLPGDKRVAFGGVSARGWAGVIDLEGGKPPVLIRDHTNTVMAVNRSADGALAVSAGGDSNEIIVWKTADGSVVRKFKALNRAIWAVGWGKDGKSLAWGQTNRMGPDRLHGLEQTFLLDEFQTGDPPKPGAYGRQLLSDGAFSVRQDGFFQLSVFEDGKPLYSLKTGANRIYSITFVPGKGIVVGASFSMFLIDPKTGKRLREFRGDRGLTTALAPSPDGKYFVSGSTDQVLRIWSPDHDEPLMSIFAVGREWLAWVPHGYYACSPFGERLIAWQVNSGVDKAPAVHPAVRFRSSLYQPALLKYLVPAGDLRTALAMAARFEGERVGTVGVGDVLPPAVTITAPERATDKPITVRGMAEGSEKNPIVAMRLLVDGRPYRGAAGVKRFDKKPKAEATWELALGPGVHSLAVLAESQVSKGMSARATCTREGAEPKPNLYVLAVGVSAYPGRMRLRYAASDALLLTKTIKEKSKGVFADIEMKVLTDREATLENIQDGLTWLKSKMTAHDVGIFFFSGHGGRDRPGRLGEYYLIPVDVGPDMASTCLSGDDLKTRLGDMPGRLVAILDACHAGEATDDDPPPVPADSLVRDLMTDDYGVVVLASSLGREPSQESPLLRAGLYTFGLVEGLSGRADYDHDGLVYLNELTHYATVRVQELSRGRQNPTVGRPPTVRPFPIAKP